MQIFGLINYIFSFFLSVAFCSVFFKTCILYKIAWRPNSYHQIFIFFLASYVNVITTNFVSHINFLLDFCSFWDIRVYELWRRVHGLMSWILKTWDFCMCFTMNFNVLICVLYIKSFIISKFMVDLSRKQTWL